MSAGESRSCLSREEVDMYHREGWLVPEARVPTDVVSDLRSALDTLIKDNPDVRPERLTKAHLEDRGAEGVKGHPAFFEAARNPIILDAVEQLIGPDICLWGVQVFCKPAGTGMKVPMHQDGHYWPIRPMATVTVWLALDSSDPENGCLQVVPKSHVEKRNYEHYKSGEPDLVLNQAVLAEELEALEAPVDVILQPGQFSMHESYLVHGSNANTSTRRRAGIAMRYMPTTSIFRRDLFKTNASAGYTVDWEGRPIFLLRGKDQSGQNKFSAVPERPMAESPRKRPRI